MGFSLLNSAYAESTAYDTATNVMTIPFVQLNNHNYSNVRFICDPEDGYSCRLLGGEPSDCASGIYNVNGSASSTYSIHTRSSGGIQFGGILLSNPDGLEFTASWIKSPKDQNPYLVGQDLTQFSDNIAYGVIGGGKASPGFSMGDLITVTGDSTGYSVTQVNGDATLAFTKGEKINVNNSCNSQTGEYTGDLDYNKNNFYNINILNNTSGGIQLANTKGYVFTASWDGTEKLLNKYSLANLGAIYTNPYPGFSEEDQAFVTDIGNGIVLTSIDAFTGKVSSTAVFIQNQ
ncbi:MAG: hypothetical protein L3J59_05540 [Methylococcaceae bacterium]|nr:hypothetical protein [Methylococcaceae bacterium]